VLWLKEPPIKPRIMGSVAVFRAATLSDAAAISEVYLASRKRFLPYAPLAHTDEQVRAWIAKALIPNSDVNVALMDNEIVGMMAVSQNGSASWIDQLYVHPRAVGQGIGTGFIEQAKKSQALQSGCIHSRQMKGRGGFTKGMGSKQLPTSTVQETKRSARMFYTSGACRRIPLNPGRIRWNL
jgi:GNAT superfamily N-acetyltransferase